MESGLILEKLMSRSERGENGCLNWTGYREKKGYGRIQAELSGVRQMFLTHRLSWILQRGEIPPGMFVCHHCNNPPCIEISHLFLGTNSDNMADCVSKQRQAKGEGVNNAKLTEPQIREIIELAKSMTQEQIAEMMGVSQGNIGRILRREAWTCVDVQVDDSTVFTGKCRRRAKGCGHGRAKLTEDMVREIRRLKTSMTQQQIAVIYEVSQAVVSSILRGKAWRHVA